jgi:hypothetical protein
VFSVPLTNGVGAITDLQVPIAAAYPCVTAKDPVHSVTDAASTTVVARQYAVSFTLRQGDATNDDVVDIFDYATFVTSRGIGKAPDAQSNYTGDTVISGGVLEIQNVAASSLSANTTLNGNTFNTITTATTHEGFSGAI